MTGELRVYLDGTPVGTLTQTPQGALGFTYDAAYEASDDPTPLSLSMPVGEHAFGNRVTTAYFSGLLPDNERVRQRWAVEFGVSANNPFGLLRHKGRDAAGAVQVLDPGVESDDAARRTGQIQWLSDADVQAMLARLADGTPDWDPGRFAGRWSLAGGQPKVALYRDPETRRWGVPLDSTPTTHILKPSTGQLTDLHLNEVICQRAARYLGLPAATTEVLEAPGVQAVVSQRYDRVRDAATGRLGRLHQEDLCQALAVPPERKYQEDGGPGVPPIGRFIARLDVADRTSVAQRLFDALVFNVVIGGTDAHAKNYSLLLRGHRVQLAPLYDVISWAPHDDNPARSHSPIKIGDHTQLSAIGPRDWIKAGRHLTLDAEHCVTRLRELHGSLPDALAAAVGSLPEDLQQRGRTLADSIVRLTERLP